jgi:hypothetical protein
VNGAGFVISAEVDSGGDTWDSGFCELVASGKERPESTWAARVSEVSDPVVVCAVLVVESSVAVVKLLLELFWLSSIWVGIPFSGGATTPAAGFVTTLGAEASAVTGWPAATGDTLSGALGMTTSGLVASLELVGAAWRGLLELTSAGSVGAFGTGFSVAFGVTGTALMAKFGAVGLGFFAVLGLKGAALLVALGAGTWPEPELTWGALGGAARTIGTGFTDADGLVFWAAEPTVSAVALLEMTVPNW